MTTLTSIPPDVLSQIVSASASSAILLRLWSCGDSRLHRLLTFCVDSIDLRDSRLATTPKFPSIIFGLKPLRSLSLVHAEVPMERYSLVPPSKERFAPHLLALDASKLQTLLLWSPNIIEDFQQLIASLRLKHPQSSTSTPLVTSPMLGLAFPSLTTLNLNSRGMLGDILAELPSTLTSLSLLHAVVRVPIQDFFALLPRPLLILDGLVSFMNMSAATSPKSPPPQLHTVSTIAWYGADDSHLACLPATLTKCKLYGTELAKPATLDLLPQIDSLYQLNIDQDSFDAADRSWASALPRALTFLDLNGTVKLNTGDILLLPKTLTSLHTGTEQFLRRWDWLESTFQNDIDFWPPSLRSMAIRQIRLSNKDLKLLPRALTSLTFLNADRMIDLDCLPPALESLTFSRCLAFSVRGRMPNTLNLVRTESSDRALGNVATEFFAALPSTLQSISLPWPAESERLQPEPTFALPTSLTTLKLTTWHINWCFLLPSTLQSFSAQLQGLKPRPDFDDIDFFTAFPSSLTVLHTGLQDRFKRKSPLSEHSFSSLQHLVDFSFCPYGGFHANILKHLPSCLRKLQIEIYEGWSSTELLPYINPKWVELHLNGLTAAEYKALGPHWPPEALDRPTATRW